MEQRGTTAVLFLLLAATSAVTDEPRPLPKEIQGEWVAVELEYRGQRPPADVISKYQVVVKEDKLTLWPLMMANGQFNVEGDTLEVQCQYDPKASPKTIDLIFKEGNEEIRMLGIYAIEGKQLKICWQHDGKGRPKEFKIPDTFYFSAFRTLPHKPSISR
jgi:uncharacterized protein (TIGR03067 family)